MWEENTVISQTKLFVGGLNWKIRGKELREEFSKFGEVAFAKKYHKCPICGNDELYTGDGCMTCLECAWTKC